MGLIVALGVSSLLMPVIFGRWRRGVFIVIVWFMMEDLIRKFMGNDMTIYLIKDIILIMTYLSCVLRPYPLRARQHLPGVALALWVVWIVVNCFNPLLPHPLFAVSGVRIWLFYVPCFFLGFRFLEEPGQLLPVVRLIVSLAAIVSVIGLLQMMFGPTWLNPRYVPELLEFKHARILPGEPVSFLRPNSVFVDTSRFAQYLFVASTLLLGLIVSRFDRHLGKPVSGLWMWGSLGLIITSMGGSGHRTLTMTILIVFVILVIIRFMTFMSQQPRGLRRMAIPVFRLVVIGALTWVVLHQVVPKQLKTVTLFYTKTLLPQEKQFDITRRSQSSWDDVVRAVRTSGLMGHGTGSSSLGLRHLYRIVGMPMPASPYQIEGGFATVGWELGLLGVVFWIFWGLRWIQLLLRDLRQLQFSPYYGFGICIVCYVAIKLFIEFSLHDSSYQDYISAFYLWFFGGVVARLAEFAQAGRPHDAG